MQELLQQISEAMQSGRAKLVKQYVTQAMEEQIPALEILNDALMTGMGVIGERFKNNEIFVPEVLVAARAMNAGIDLIRPLLAAGGMGSKGTAVIGTVKGDLHDIGKNLVRMMMEGKGIEMIDLGTDVSADRFYEAAMEHHAQLVCCSTLLTTTMAEMANVVSYFDQKGARDKVKFMVGGAPVTQSFCDAIGADCYTPDAATAAETALELLA
ncbi:corrinoid protein [Lawsonibacter faecis]|uniref:Corrinoid protein n=1 Tax=Lawsonibacter faecis TaxID=2763052 RepID=A0A8J6JHP6_9FIRM|nr:MULTISPECIES: corrinoid protein [Oscillospiraceae]MTQ95832.1 cobalamin-binding protein [Pseudoflavonifractor sp. BIOML-A16]MTR04584.1 cobalamin-binding protein [Pseudoflavonifractor sp. BIOML-A15]MTR31168.1 cobalamin-binding protein [Pseudoflavonifractor sp. BIOML-A14]MTR71733.1 cobalamin-binding protein [Pseudoflavonifractor sp. BIOML-A18]MTS62724.1 cobalamin-binding protein [Pseudoflavonifractor sp. BIOML-A5]MTS71682.1 cobalamin-binding protein [Pseudoflavonifractor sp. BIOML-A8]MTS8989